MKLFTKALLKMIPRLEETNELTIAEQKAYVKLFHPFSNFYWYITAYNPEENLAFGYVKGFDGELGYINMSELENLKIRGLGIERDLYFDPMNLRELIDKIEQGVHV